MGAVVHIGVGRLDLLLPESHSLKDRRQVSRSLTARIRQQFNVGVAEAPEPRLWRRLTLVVCCVSSDADLASEVVAGVAAFVEQSRPDLQLLDCHTEIISGV